MRRWAAVLLALVVVCGAVVLVVSRRQGGPDAGRAPELPEPRSITRKGVTYRVEPASPPGAVLDPTDGRVLTVYASDVEGGSPSCSFLDPQVRLVSESDEAVRIAAFDYTGSRAAGDDSTGCMYASMSSGSASMYRSLPVHLRRPLGERRLIDVRSGQGIGILDASYAPRPAYVPAGYRQSLVTHFTPKDDFVAIRQYRNGSTDALEVRVRSASVWSRSGRVIAVEEVAGGAATVTDESYERCVSWFPRTDLVAEVCSLADDFLPAGELGRIARSLAPL